MSLKLRKYFQTHWKLIAIYGGLFAVLAATLLWQLNTLTPGYSPGEVNTYNSSLSLRAILENPLNAPFHLAVRAAIFFHPDSYIVTRLVSVAAGLIVLAIFAAVLRHWHDDRTAIAGTLLFGLSAWFLHVARLGTPGVLLFGVFVAVACGFWLKHTKSSLALFACFLSVAALLYVPGMIWFVAVGIFWQWKSIDRIFKRHLAVITGAGVAFLVALAPLGYGLYKHHELIRPFLGLPAEWPGLVQIAKNIFLVPFHLFVHNASNPATWLGSAPILDVFSLTMLVLGSWLYLKHWRLARTPIFILILLVSAGLMAVGSPITYSVVIPFLYIIIAAGMMHLLTMWFSIFPRNPIARGLGWGLGGIVVALAISYHLTHYFVGWPQAQATHNVFTAQKP